MYLVCGEALYDFFLDQEIGHDQLTFDARIGGSPFNVAMGISRLKYQAGLFTGVSTDLLGERLVTALQQEAVSTDYLVRLDRRTTISLVGTDAHGSPSYSFYGEGAADRTLTPADLPELPESIVGLHFGSFSLVVEPVGSTSLALAQREKHRFISVDPNIRPTVEADMAIWEKAVADYAQVADLLKISAEDIEMLYGDISHDALAAKWLGAGVKLVIITDGGELVKAWHHSGYTAQAVPPSIEIADAVGAGDTFQAALLTQLAELGSPKDIIDRITEETLSTVLKNASNAAAITCSRRGADLPRREELNW